MGERGNGVCAIFLWGGRGEDGGVIAYNVDVVGGSSPIFRVSLACPNLTYFLYRGRKNPSGNWVDTEPEVPDLSMCFCFSTPTLLSLENDC